MKAKHLKVASTHSVQMVSSQCIVRLAKKLARFRLAIFYRGNVKSKC